MSATVKYNPLGGGTYTLDPPPFVSQSIETIDTALMRLGNIENYELDGLFSGQSGISNIFSGISNIFSRSPGVLKIESNNVTILEKTESKFWANTEETFNEGVPILTDELDEVLKWLFDFNKFRVIICVPIGWTKFFTVFLYES